MQVCEFPRWAFLDSCRSEMRLELAGVGGGTRRSDPSVGCAQDTRELDVLESWPHCPGVDSQRRVP